MDKSLPRIALIVIFAFLVQVASGQEFPMLHFTNEDGLPGNTVYQVYRDSKGMLWFGTDKGVARYNGVHFDVFTTFNGLPDNEVFMFSEDLYGRLWLVSFNGELCYYKDDTFHTPRNTPYLRLPIQSSPVKFITPQKDSSVIVTFNNKTRFLNITGDKSTVIDLGKVYTPTMRGELLYRKKTAPNRYKLTFANHTIIVDTQMNIKQEFDVDTFTMYAGGNGQMYASCQNQDYLFNKQYLYSTELKYLAAFPADFHKNNYLNRAFFSLNHKFYATNNGLYINDTIQVLKDHNVSSVSNDRYGNYWISTLNNGVYVIKHDFLRTRVYNGHYDGRVVYSFANKRQLFFATVNSNFYHLADNKVNCLVNYEAISHEKYLHNSNQVFLVDSSKKYFSIINHDIIYKGNVFDKKAILKRTDGAHGAKKLFCLNGYLFLQKPDAILKYKFDSTAGNTTSYVRMGISQSDYRILWVARDNSNNLWYSTVKGLYKISDTGTVTEQKKFKNISFKTFEFIGDDLVGYTNNNLLYIFRNVTGPMRMEAINLQDCIWDEFYKIDDENMLISTNNLYRLLRVRWHGDKKYEVLVIDNPFIPFQPDAATFDDSMCYFLKGGVITTFDKESLKAKPAPPRLYFTELLSGTSKYIIGDLVKIPYSEAKNVSISFAIVSFPRSNVIYQYSVSKNDKNYWVDIKSENISLVNSGYGNFTVKIRAKTLSSDFCKPVEFTLRINRPFWSTWWFIVLSIACGSYIILILSRKRLAYILSRKDKEHDMKVRFMKSEYKALNALMNPHFIFNTLNNVQALVNKNDKLAANEYLRVIADLIRQNMHNISKELIPLQKEIDLVSNYLLLEKLRFKEKLNYTIIVDKGLDLSEVMIPPLLIQPLVENSIKHGILCLESGEGAIYINIFERKGILCIEIKDNGVGLNYKKSENLSTHESFGLENIRKRIEQLSVIQNKEITFEIKERRNDSGSIHWTVVTINIPLDTA